MTNWTDMIWMDKAVAWVMATGCGLMVTLWLAYAAGLLGE